MTSPPTPTAAKRPFFLKVRNPSEFHRGGPCYWYDSNVHTPDNWNGIAVHNPRKHIVTQVFPNRKAVMVVPA